MSRLRKPPLLLTAAKNASHKTAPYQTGGNKRLGPGAVANFQKKAPVNSGEEFNFTKDVVLLNEERAHVFERSEDGNIVVKDFARLLKNLRRSFDCFQRTGVRSNVYREIFHLVEQLKSADAEVFLHFLRELPLAAQQECKKHLDRFLMDKEVFFILYNDLVELLRSSQSKSDIEYRLIFFTAKFRMSVIKCRSKVDFLKLNVSQMTNISPAVVIRSLIQTFETEWVKVVLVNQ